MLEIIFKVFGFGIAESYRLSPRFAQRAMIHALATLFLVAGLKKKVIDQNLTYAFGSDEHSKALIKRGFYRHFASLILEIFQHLGRFDAFAKKQSRLTGLEHYQKAMTLGKGVILLSSHVGNWELMSASGGMAGMDLMIITKKLKPEWLHAQIEKSRLKVGVKGAYEPHTLKSVLKHLRQGRAVGIVLDQFAGPPIGVRVPYFSVPVGTSSAAAMLAKRTGTPVLPVVTHRDSQGVLHTKICPPHVWIEAQDPHEELALNTAHYVRTIESDVRAYPDQWLWTHRRFKGDLSPLRPNEWKAPRLREWNVQSS